MWPIQEITENAEQKLKAFSEKFFPGLKVRRIVSNGDPGLCITDFARTDNVDLIMMPTHGHGRFRALLLGSVATKTLHDAPCAVWTASHCNKLPATGGWKRILCAVDTDEEGRKLIRKAAELSGNSETIVRLLHAVPPPPAAGDPVADAGFVEFLLDAAKSAVAGMQTDAGTSFEAQVKSGFVTDVVRDTAIDWEADLVLIGKGVFPRFAGQLRSHAWSIIRNVPCPVLSA
jgi:nucleotide-binding universal stress UspA family protein